MLAVKDFGSGEQFLMFATAKGGVKKTALAAYANIRTTGIIAIGLEDGDQLIGVEITGGNDEIILGTKLGLAIRFSETDVRAMGRPAGGVSGLKFKRDGDEVVSMVVVATARRRPQVHDPDRHRERLRQADAGRRLPPAGPQRQRDHQHRRHRPQRRGRRHEGRLRDRRADDDHREGHPDADQDQPRSARPAAPPRACG